MRNSSPAADKVGIVKTCGRLRQGHALGNNKERRRFEEDARGEHRKRRMVCTLRTGRHRKTHVAREGGNEEMNKKSRFRTTRNMLKKYQVVKYGSHIDPAERPRLPTESSTENSGRGDKTIHSIVRAVFTCTRACASIIVHVSWADSTTTAIGRPVSRG